MQNFLTGRLQLSQLILIVNLAVNINSRTSFSRLTKKDVPLSLDSLAYYFSKEFSTSNNKVNFELTLTDDDKTYVSGS